MSHEPGERWDTLDTFTEPDHHSAQTRVVVERAPVVDSAPCCACVRPGNGAACPAHPPSPTALAQPTGRRASDEPYVQTLTGAHWYFANPLAADVVFDDLRALSRISRYGGHTGAHCDFYSVAEHSVRVARMLAAQGHGVQVQLAGLLHDGGEAYPPGDMLGPVVRWLEKIGASKAVLEMRDAAQRCVVERFGVADVFQVPGLARLIHYADRTLLATERRDLMSAGLVDWGPLPEPLPEVIEPWSAVQAWLTFRSEFNRLVGLSARGKRDGGA